jgi:two-component system, NarL family, invasion response regulator UvrY
VWRRTPCLRKNDIVEEPGTRSVSVLVADDSPIFLRAASLLLRSVPGIHLAGVANSGEQAVESVARDAPDIALIDIRMDGIGGIEAARRIVELQGHTTVVLITAEAEHSVPSRAHSCGAAAVVCKQRLLPATVAGFRDLALGGSPG